MNEYIYTHKCTPTKLRTYTETCMHIIFYLKTLYWIDYEVIEKHVF